MTYSKNLLWGLSLFCFFNVQAFSYKHARTISGGVGAISGIIAIKLHSDISRLEGKREATDNFQSILVLDKQIKRRKKLLYMALSLAGSGLVGSAALQFVNKAPQSTKRIPLRKPETPLDERCQREALKLQSHAYKALAEIRNRQLKDAQTRPNPSEDFTTLGQTSHSLHMSSQSLRKRRYPYPASPSSHKALSEQQDALSVSDASSETLETPETQVVRNLYESGALTTPSS